MNHLDTFSGIGCFSMAAEYVWQDDYEILSFVEWDKFKQKWLRANWPGVPIHDDADTYKHDGTKIDLLTGGPPCQAVSIAGKRTGDKDDRWKWPAMLRIIQDVQPKWIIFENVYGLVNFNGGLLLDGICLDMEAAGYEVFPPFIIPACSQNAPHRRDRVWVVGHAEHLRQPQPQGGIKNKRGRVINSGKSGLGDTTSQRLQIGELQRETQRKPDKSSPGENSLRGSDLCGMADTTTSRPQTKRDAKKQQSGNVNIYNPWSDYTWITGHDGKQRRVPQLSFCRLDDGDTTGNDRPDIGLLAKGQPYRADFLRSFGEAIVWQTVVPIMRAIKEIEDGR